MTACLQNGCVAVITVVNHTRPLKDARCSLHTTAFMLHPTRYRLHTTGYTLQPTHYSLHATAYILHATARYPEISPLTAPLTLNLVVHTVFHQPKTLARPIHVI